MLLSSVICSVLPNTKMTSTQTEKGGYSHRKTRGVAQSMQEREGVCCGWHLELRERRRTETDPELSWPYVLSTVDADRGLT